MDCSRAFACGQLRVCRRNSRNDKWLFITLSFAVAKRTEWTKQRALVCLVSFSFGWLYGIGRTNADANCTDWLVEKRPSQHWTKLMVELAQVNMVHWARAQKNTQYWMEKLEQKKKAHTWQTHMQLIEQLCSFLIFLRFFFCWCFCLSFFVSYFPCACEHIA